MFYQYLRVSCLITRPERKKVNIIESMPFQPKANENLSSHNKAVLEKFRDLTRQFKKKKLHPFFCTNMPPKKSIQRTSNKVAPKGPAKASKGKKQTLAQADKNKKTKDQKV